MYTITPKPSNPRIMRSGVATLLLSTLVVTSSNCADAEAFELDSEAMVDAEDEALERLDNEELTDEQAEVEAFRAGPVATFMLQQIAANFIQRGLNEILPFPKDKAVTLDEASITRIAQAVGQTVSQLWANRDRNAADGLNKNFKLYSRDENHLADSRTHVQQIAMKAPTLLENLKDYRLQSSRVFMQVAAIRMFLLEEWYKLDKKLGGDGQNTFNNIVIEAEEYLRHISDLEVELGQMARGMIQEGHKRNPTTGMYENCLNIPGENDICWDTGSLDPVPPTIEIRRQMANARANAVDRVYWRKHAEVFGPNIAEFKAQLGRIIGEGETLPPTVSFRTHRSGRCVTVHGGSMANGAEIDQWDCFDQTNQKFNVVDSGDAGYVYLKAQHSQKCLTIRGASSANGAVFEQWDCVNQDNQKFALDIVGTADDGDLLYKVVNKGSGKAMTVNQASRERGAHIEQWDWVNRPHQNFEVRGAPLVPRVAEIKPVHSNKCISMRDFDSVNGSDAIQWDCYRDQNQRFSFWPRGDGSYEIRTEHSNMCLGVDDGEDRWGENLDQEPCVGADYQSFYLDHQGNNRYQIRAKHSGLCLNVSQASTENDADLIQWGCTGSDHERFKILID